MFSEQQLSDVLSEFARTMVTEFPIQAILDHLVGRIVEILPVSAAGVTLISAGHDPKYVAASDGSAMRFEELQTELGEGPCVLAYQTGEAVTVADLREEGRFPAFTARALQEGLSAVFTFPLNHGDRQLGALDLYRETPGALSAETMISAQTLADVAAAYLLNAQARDDLQQSTERSREAALHDALTGLPNRVLLLERIEHAFLRGQRSGRRPAVLFVDLDQFKTVNDTYGHRGGDQLLVAFAGRMRRLLRPEDTLARLAGDEFVILCEDLDDVGQAGAIADRVEAGLGRPFVLSGLEVAVTASIGVAFAAAGASDAEQLVHNADMAMYEAKHQGGARRRVLDMSQDQLGDQQIGLTRDLREALGRGELHLDYQPIVTVADGLVTGVEALLRWAHPTRGSLAPTTLIPVAERAGLADQIGLWVLETAWADRHRWQHTDRADELTMSVNVSAQQLMAPSFVGSVAALLDRVSITPRLLTLDVTERAFVRDSGRALIVLDDLKELGVTLALDDFGTGYSSLSYLSGFPLDIVKIDRTLLAGTTKNSNNRFIVSAIVELAHKLGISVVAEGVETAEQLHEIARLGCDLCQGYYFAPPMSSTDLDRVIHPDADDRYAHLPAPSR